MSKVTGATELSARISSLDFLRGVAILGILFINIESFAYPDPWSPWKFGFQKPLDYTTRFWIYFLTQGKFYTIFALLFGVSFSIFTERLKTKGLGLKAMDIYSRRLFWLFIIGIIHSYFIWDGDILYHYAICGFLLFPFRSIKTRNLVLIISILGIVQLNKTYDQTISKRTWRDNYTKAINIPDNQKTKDNIKQIIFWEKLTTKKEPDTSKVEIKKKTYTKGLKETYRNSKVHIGILYYPGIIFSTLMVMILGIIFYRSGIFQNYKVWKYYWHISITILCIGLVINFFRYYHWTFEYFDPVTSIWKGLLFTFPKELLGVGYLLILNGLYQKYIRYYWALPIIQIGQTALSNYIFQNTILGFIFYGYGLAQFNQFSRVELLPIVIIIWVIQFALTRIWLKYKKQGPLENVWRRLTYQSFHNHEE